MPKALLSSENTERLIELVRKNKVLYDLKDPGYHDADVLANVWESITKALEINGTESKC